jgi:hypothetical protein
MTNLYHATSIAAAQSIDSGGFRDAPFMSVAHGVCVSDRPLDAADGVARHCDVIFEIEIPSGFDLEEFEIIEEERPVDAYREWLIPAAKLNLCARRRMALGDIQ